MAEVQQTIESKTQFTDDALGWAGRWSVEVSRRQEDPGEVPGGRRHGREAVPR